MPARRSLGEGGPRATRRGRVRLLMTISDLSGGGAEREFSNLAHHLSRDRFELHVCLWRETIRYRLPDDVRVTVIDKTRPWHLWRTVRRLRGVLRDVRPDVVFSMLQYTNLVTGTALRAMPDRPAWACRFVSPAERTLRGVKRPWARATIRTADRVLGCSEGVTGSLRSVLDLDPDRMRTIRNPVDLQRVADLGAQPLPVERPPDRRVILTVGRLSPQKNQRLLLGALDMLRHRPLDLWVLGKGPEERSLKAEARRRGLEDRVMWFGFQENPFPFMKAADLFVLSSNWEGLPNTLIEAMACGTPAVATDCPYGPNELVADSETGLLVPMDDAEAMSGAITRLLDEPSLASRLRENAHRFVNDKFALPCILEEYESLFTSLASQ